MRRLLIISILFTPLASVGYAAATFSTNTVVKDGDYYDYVDVDPYPNSTVTVSMIGGKIDNLSTWQGSVFSMSGGSVGFDSSMPGGTGLQAFDNSNIEIKGSSKVDWLWTYDDSVVNIRRAQQFNWLDCYGASQVHLYISSYTFNESYSDNTGLISGQWTDLMPFEIQVWNIDESKDHIYFHIQPRLCPFRRR